MYYFEIRNRFWLLLVSWVSVQIICYFYKEVLLFMFLKPGLYIRLPSSPFYFVFTDVTEIFSVYFKIILFTANVVIFFIFWYHLFSFCYPGLYLKEQLYVKKFFATVLILGLLSWVFLNSFLLPLSYSFFFNLQESSKISIYFESKITDYLNFYIILSVSCFFYSQVITFLIFMLDYIGVSVAYIKYSRKFFYFSFILISTLITPPDVSSQLLLSFCAICSYEIVIFFQFINYYK